MAQCGRCKAFCVTSGRRSSAASTNTLHGNARAWLPRNREAMMKPHGSLAVVIALSLSSSVRADVAPPLSPPEAAISNKALVTEMFQKMFVEKQVDKYADVYLAPDFIEHDPASSNGTKALKAFFKDFN